MTEIDWNVELRKIEREYDGLPPEPSAAKLRAERAAEQRRRERAAATLAFFGAWARLLLVGALGASLLWWPYGRTCGIDLAAFLGAGAMIAVGGAWTAAFTWRHRLPATHVVAIVIFIVGVALLAAETLPRIGYGSVAWVKGDRWACSASTLPRALR